jgi:hypothetical protein
MEHNSYVEFVILTSATVKSTVFLDVTPCSLIEDRHCYGGTNFLHFVVETLMNLRQTSKSHIPEDTSSTLQNCVFLRLFHVHKRNSITCNISHRVPEVHIRINRNRP